MNIYLAAASSEIDLAERWMNALRNVGHIFTRNDQLIAGFIKMTDHE